MRVVLDKYEQEIEDALDKGEFISAPNLRVTKQMFLFSLVIVVLIISTIGLLVVVFGFLVIIFHYIFKTMPTILFYGLFFRRKKVLVGMLQSIST